jgi:phenylacetate-CoA ligase
MLVAWECASHNGLHINAGHVVLECLPRETIGSGEELGRAVVTGLDSFAMPFIRYVLGDLCPLPPRTCSCGSTKSRAFISKVPPPS